MVAQYNIAALHKLGTPVFTVKAIHSDTTAASTKPDDAGCLDPVIFLAQGARVMLTANLWQEVGLCNGAAGTVMELLFADGRSPNLPITVIVKFNSYAGPLITADCPCCVPVARITYEWHSGAKYHSRQQVPLRLRYAITIKSNGQTLDKAVIDLGKMKLAARCTFVAISRLHYLEDGLFQSMAFDRLTSIAKGK